MAQNEDVCESLKSGQQDQSEFTIPELPAGTELNFALVSAWDDPAYIGLSGIEIFTHKGARPHIKSLTSNAIESFGNLNELMHFSMPHSSAERTKGWICRYNREKDHSPIQISVKFDDGPQIIAMIRIWNYNESRVHSLRGVRHLEIELDGVQIFRGEITCALNDSSSFAHGDTILFTTNEEILATIANNDRLVLGNELSLTKQSLSSLQLDEKNVQQNISITKRPITSETLCLTPSAPILSSTAFNFRQEDLSVEIANDDKNSPGFNVETKNEHKVECHYILDMELLCNWGYPGMIGLTGVQFLGQDSKPITQKCIISCEPKRIGDNVYLQNLVNGNNLTTDPEEMFKIEMDDGDTPPMLRFAFSEKPEIIGISIWNFNSSCEMSYAGVHSARFYFNGNVIVNSSDCSGIVILRKAPGYVLFDFVQDIFFDRCQLQPIYKMPRSRSLFAFVYELKLLQSWGDDFYIGLNGIEIFDPCGQMIRLRPQNLAAFPESINILPTVNGDPRTSDKLIDGENDTTRSRHMWLTPILPNNYARIFIIFDTPMCVSRIRIYNYRKTPQRGVRYITIYADDYIIKSEEIPMSTSSKTGILDLDFNKPNL